MGKRPKIEPPNGWAMWCLYIVMMTLSNGNIFRVTGHLCGKIHRSPVNSPHKGQWRGALMFSLICVWINDWVNNREAGDLRRYQAHYDVIIMVSRMVPNSTVVLQDSPRCHYKCYSMLHTMRKVRNAKSTALLVTICLDALCQNKWTTT